MKHACFWSRCKNVATTRVTSLWVPETNKKRVAACCDQHKLKSNKFYHYEPLSEPTTAPTGCSGQLTIEALTILGVR